MVTFTKRIRKIGNISLGILFTKEDRKILDIKENDFVEIEVKKKIPN